MVAVQVKAWLLFAKSQSVLRLSHTLLREICSYFQDLYFAAVYCNIVELYNLPTQQCTLHSLSVNLRGGSCIQVDAYTLLCLGGYPASTAVYALNLPSLTLTSLPPLRTPRGAAGVAKAAHTVFVFGGVVASYCSLKSSEKYELENRQWLPLGDMWEGRYGFTPCTFYLPCPLTTPTIETFSPQTETFTVLPVSLPFNMI